jgi:hypothetical protein
MEDEVCDCVVENLLKRQFYCRDFASKNEIIETADQSTPFLTKMVKQSKNILSDCSDYW